MTFIKLTQEEKKKRKEARQKLQYEKEHKNLNGIIYKLCNKHNIFFPNENEWIPMSSEYFYQNKSNHIDGLHPECKRCSSAKFVQWTKDNKDQHNKNNRNAYKENKWDVKGIMRKNSKRRRKNGEYKNWQQNNSDKISIYNQKRRELKTHDMYIKEWESCKERFNYRCAYCGISEIEHKKLYKEQLHKEHVVFDGKNDLSNCVPACKVCNSEKHEMSLNDYYNNKNINYTYERYHNIYLWLRYDYKKYILPKRRFKGQRLTQRLKEIELNKTK